MAPLITLISGCSTGIGMELAVRLAKDPNSKYLVYATMRNLGKKDALTEAAGDNLDKTLFIRQLDVTIDDQVKSIYDFIMEKHGRIDVLVNNAGYGFFGPLETMSMEKAKIMFETNYFGTVRLIKGALPAMKKQKSGSIVNISSIVGHLGIPFMDMYNASKFAMEGLTESLRPQLKEFGIGISTVQPGPVTTKFGENMMAISDFDDNSVSEDTKKQFLEFRKVISNPDIFSPQTAEPVIDVIVKAIEAEKPRLRYPTSQNVGDWLAKRYVKEDVTGTEGWF
ncbi:retinol dehydrogenase 8-like [Lytechinus variegatus]|uniref:retinol dehydrogenase 8-like n=1 Tax=Lytechinus variegatus TaxID=7654 RepID=UPI001BB28272|nr:retinol dehydrogenase 8-like [Lytechinus variegatus]